MERTYCFGCGAEVPPAPVPGMSICANCRFEATPETQVWMVRHGDQAPQGPFPRGVIEDRIQRGLVASTDEVTRPDGPWKPFDVHEDFRAWFCPGDARLEMRLQAIQSRTRIQKNDDSRIRRRVLIVVATCLVAIGVSIGAWKTGAFVAPASWIDTLSSFTSRSWDRAASLLGRARSEEQAARALQAEGELPGQDVIAALHALKEGVPARLHFVRGRSALLASPVDPPDEAIRQLEAAAAGDPKNVQILAALVEGWASTLKDHPERTEATLAIVSRVNALEVEGPAGAGARASLALAGGSYAEALAQADRCIALDPDNLGCQAHRARALMELDRWAEARTTWVGLTTKAPHVPSWGFALAATDTEDGRLRSARGRVDGLLASWPTQPAILALSARIAWSTGDWTRARDDGALALASDPSDVQTRILAVQAALSAGTPVEARELLGPALDDSMEKEARRTILLLDSHARRLDQDNAGAIAAATQALGGEPAWAPGALALALAHQQDEDLPAAEAALKDADTTGLPPSEAANVHVALGRIYLDQERPKAAIASFERAVEVDPDNPAARLGLAETYLVLANGPRALQAVRDAAMTVLEQQKARPPFLLCPLPARDPKTLLEGLSGLTTSDPSLEASVARAQGIVHFLTGEPARARPLLELALKRDRQDAAARVVLGRMAMAEERWVDADALLTPLLVNPECEALSAALLGFVRFSEARPADALSLLKRAVKLSDGTGTFHRLLAEVLFRTDDAAAGLEQARRAWQLDPQDWQARRVVLLYGPEA
jgi:tetratricopeptide (TPR) repeat protein